MIDPVILLAFVPGRAGAEPDAGGGHDVLFRAGLKAGPRAGIAASAGVALGCMVHVTVAGAGLGAMVAASRWRSR
jgi:hypothetical protein